MSKQRYELSSVQKNIWMLENFYKGKPINNLNGYVIFNEIVDYGAMVEALNYYLKENEIIRAKIKLDGDDLYQEISEEVDVKPQVYDFTKQTKEKVDEFINEYARIPIDISKNMFEFNILYLKDKKTIVLAKFHHLIADAWSFISLFMNDMVEYYYKVLNKEELNDSKEDCKYSILLKREKEYKESQKYLDDKEFWKEEMKGLENYSVMKNSSTKYSHNAKRIVKEVNKTDYEKISSFCKENKVSEYSLFLAALSIYLYRVQGSDNDITLGTPILNRVTKNEKRAAGLFISTIPLRVKVEEDKTFLDVAKEISAKMFTVFRHQKYPFSEIAENVYKENSEIKKLYDVMISYQNARFTDIVKEKGITRVWPFQDYQQEQFIMHITNYENSNKLEIFYDYLVDLFEVEEVEFIHDRLLNLILTGISTEEKIKTLPMVAEEEKYLILNVFNNTDENYPSTENIISIFEKQVRKHPIKTAVKYKDEKITYRELSKKVNILAKKLIDVGVERDEVVGVKVDRSINQIISLLAVLKAGGCYMPIHPEWPEDRVLYMIEDSMPKALITQDKYIDKFTVVSDLNYNVLSNNTVIDVDKYLEEHTEETVVENSIDPDDLAYIIYTSGTTGRPKGTLITHRNVVRLLITDNYPYDFREDDVWTMFHTYTFDFSVWEMYGALLLGGTLVLVPEDVAKDTRKYLELLKTEEVTVQNQTPSYLYKVVENEMLEKDARLKLRYIILGGEAFHPRNVKDFMKKYPKTKIVNGYGVTETTVFTSQKVITKRELETNESNIGKQLPTRKVYILDKNLELLPIGVEGELCEAGLGVCEGYLNNKEMTNKKFVKNPFGEGLMYKTGDVAKYKYNGDIIYVGRNDNQVKIRGFRIEIEEIEKLLLRIKGVKKVILFAHGKTSEDKALYAFIAPEKGAILNISNIKNELLENIPLYMLPLIYIVEDFPTNTNGKADKNKLIEVIEEVKELKDKVAEKPKTELEKQVLKVFKKESNGRVVGVTDNFYENNVDSLQILNAALELNKQDINISAQDIYDSKDVRTLCKNIEQNKVSSNQNLRELAKEERCEKIYFDSQKFDLTNVFLTGASGFLGVHILKELLELKETKKIYCLIRSKEGTIPKVRLKKTFEAYFGEDDLKLLDKKVEVIEGDFTKLNFGMPFSKYDDLNGITTIINAAADVKHYGRYEDFYSSNVKSVENLLKFAKKQNASFAHISTESVCGYTEVENVTNYTEESFDIGQTFFDNVYITTKFEAEKEIIKYKENNKNANIKIFRLGNIMPRANDGMFQLNYTQNAFIQKMKGIIKMHLVPNILLESITDISPVDFCAKAVVALAKEDENMSVYHISNKNITVEKLIELLNKLNLEIQICDIEKFKEKIEDVKEDYVAILQEQFNQLGYALNIIDNESTLNSLDLIDLNWPEIDEDYMKYIVEIVNKKG